MSARKLVLASALLLGCSAPALANTFSGNLFYTYFDGRPNNVDSVTYSYDDVSHSFGLGPITPIASLNGADGIIFDANGKLLVGGQGANTVYQITPPAERWSARARWPQTAITSHWIRAAARSTPAHSEARSRH